MTRGELDGFAGADQQHYRDLQTRERFLRQAHRDRSHRDRVGADAGVGTRALGGDEGMLEQAIEVATQGACAARGDPCLLDLAEDLRLAQDQRIKTSRDPEQVPRGVAIVVAIEVIVEIATVAWVRRQPVAERAAVVVGDGIQLGAVAGRQQRDFMHLRQRLQRGERGARASSANAPVRAGDRRTVEVMPRARRRASGSAACEACKKRVEILRPGRSMPDS